MYQRAQLPHTVSDYQGPAPLIISHKKIFPVCHIKSNYCFLGFIGYLLYQRAQLPFATKVSMLWSPAPPHIQQGKTLWGPAPPRCLRLSGPSFPDHTYSKTRLCGAQLPHTVSDYQGPTPLIISHRVQLGDLDDRSLITNSQICELHFLLIRMSTCKPHFPPHL